MCAWLSFCRNTTPIGFQCCFNTDDWEDAESEASEWALRERRERVEQREAEAEELGAAGALGAAEEPPLFQPMPPFMASAGDEE